MQVIFITTKKAILRAMGGEGEHRSEGGAQHTMA